MAYIDAARYNAITGRTTTEASDQRLLMASRLLDSRVGNYVRIDDDTNAYDGFKLDLDTLRAYQKEAVEHWVAWMVAALFIGGDAPNTFQNIKLGRFSITENASQQDKTLPNLVEFADIQLKDAKIINTHVKTRKGESNDTWL
jgi:hypothetical protein